MKNLCIFLLCLASCSPIQSAPRSKQIKPNYTQLLQQGERQATPGGRRVLETGRKMTLDQKLIIPGGCWGYADAVYQKAGFPAAKRKRVFSGVKGRPTYTVSDQVQPGDWLYYINHSYNNIEHSAIFVAWIDKPKKIGLMLTYGGEQRKEPARYRAYDLRSVYRIERPVS